MARTRIKVSSARGSLFSLIDSWKSGKLKDGSNFSPDKFFETKEFTELVESLITADRLKVKPYTGGIESYERKQADATDGNCLLIETLFDQAADLLDRIVANRKEYDGLVTAQFENDLQLSQRNTRKKVSDLYHEHDAPYFDIRLAGAEHKLNENSEQHLKPVLWHAESFVTDYYTLDTLSAYNDKIANSIYAELAANNKDGDIPAPITDWADRISDRRWAVAHFDGRKEAISALLSYHQLANSYLNIYNSKAVSGARYEVAIGKTYKEIAEKIHNDYVFEEVKFAYSDKNTENAGSGALNHKERIDALVKYIHTDLNNAVQKIEKAMDGLEILLGLA